MLSIGFCDSFYSGPLLTEDPAQHHQGRGGQDHFRDQLGVGQTVQGIYGIHDEQQRDLQHHLAQNGEDQSVPAHAQSLEHAHCQEVDAQEQGSGRRIPRSPGSS